jgi:hypothetical protein
LCGSLSAHFQSRLPGKRRVSRRDELLEAKQQNSAKRVSRSEAVGHAFAESPHPELVQMPDAFGMRVVFWQPNYGEVRACVQINVAFQNIAEDLLSVRLFNLDCDRSALSPLTNHRTDEYGGAFDGRIRLALEVAAAVRAALPDSLPLFMRISAIDWVEDGWQLEDSVELARRLRPLGVHLMDCSSGGVVPHAKKQIGPAYQTPFAERIRRESGILTGAVGMITEAHQADGIIRAGQADIVLLAREFLPTHIGRSTPPRPSARPPVSPNNTGGRSSETCGGQACAAAPITNVARTPGRTLTVPPIRLKPAPIDLWHSRRRLVSGSVPLVAVPDSNGVGPCESRPEHCRLADGQGIEFQIYKYDNAERMQNEANSISSLIAIGSRRKSPRTSPRSCGDHKWCQFSACRFSIEQLGVDFRNESGLKHKNVDYIRFREWNTSNFLGWSIGFDSNLLQLPSGL